MKNKRETWIYLALTVFVTLVILIVNECFHPYFFLCDDNLDSYITQYLYTIECLKSFELPLYNFHRFMGIEFLSHGQTGLFDPVMYISTPPISMITARITPPHFQSPFCFFRDFSSKGSSKENSPAVCSIISASSFK